MKEDLLKIINHYGVLPQLKYFQSEVFELNEAILTKEIEYYSSDTTVRMDKANLQHIAEEIGDVLVMVYQFVEYYNIDQLELCKTMDFKINRQLERIKDESNE